MSTYTKLPVFARLVNKWLNHVTQVSRELIVSYRLAKVPKSFMKEAVPEASYTTELVNNSTVSQEGTLTGMRQQHSECDPTILFNQRPIWLQDLDVSELWT